MRGFREFISTLFWPFAIHPDYKWRLLYSFVMLEVAVIIVCQWTRRAVLCCRGLEQCKRLFYSETLHMFQGYFMALVGFVLCSNLTIGAYLCAVVSLTLLANHCAPRCCLRRTPRTNLVQYVPAVACGAIGPAQFVVLTVILYGLHYLFYLASSAAVHLCIAQPIDLAETLCMVCDNEAAWNGGWVAAAEFCGTLCVEWVAVRRLVEVRYVAELMIGAAFSSVLLVIGRPFVFVFFNPMVSTMKLYLCSKYDPTPLITTNWLPPILGALLGNILFSFEECCQWQKASPDEKGDE